MASTTQSNNQRKPRHGKIRFDAACHPCWIAAFGKLSLAVQTINRRLVAGPRPGGTISTHWRSSGPLHGASSGVPDAVANRPAAGVIRADVADTANFHLASRDVTRQLKNYKGKSARLFG
jgi:hypothetical protein